jgi:hypothetical protein
MWRMLLEVAGLVLLEEGTTQIFGLLKQGESA